MSNLKRLCTRSIWITLIVSLLMLPLLAACQPAAQAIPNGEVTFLTEDHIQLAGMLSGQGKTAVLLSVGDWSPLIERLQEEPVAVLIFNLRGNFPSQGKPSVDDIDKDMRAAIGYLRTLGFNKIICIGGSRGGTACLHEANQPGIVGVVTLSAPKKAGSVDVTQQLLSTAGCPVLLIAGEKEETAVAAASLIHSYIPKTSQVILIEGEGNHATSLFETTRGGWLVEIIVNFIQQLE